MTEYIIEESIDRKKTWLFMMYLPPGASWRDYCPSPMTRHYRLVEKVTTTSEKVLEEL